MLTLLSSTDVGWVEVALADFDAVLHDHLHCEMKAAANAVSLVARYPFHARLVRELSELAREELTHVQQVHARMSARGVGARPPGEDVYARELRRALEDGKGEPLLDRLTVAAIIEARSCERFQLIAAHATDAALREWYRDLWVSEARHHRLFASVCEDIYGEDRARERVRALAEREAEIVARLPVLARVH